MNEVQFGKRDTRLRVFIGVLLLSVEMRRRNYTKNARVLLVLVVLVVRAK